MSNGEFSQQLLSTSMQGTPSTSMQGIPATMGLSGLSNVSFGSFGNGMNIFDGNGMNVFDSLICTPVSSEAGFNVMNLADMTARAVDGGGLQGRVDWLIEEDLCGR